MGLNGDVDVEIARRPAVSAGLALASQANPVAVVDARRDLDRKRLVLAQAASAAALAAGLVDRSASTAAVRTRLLNREEPLGDSYLAHAAARLAVDRLRARLGTLAGAARALDLGRNIQRDGIARHGLLERELEVVAQIRAAKHLAATSAPTTAEDVAEHVAEDVAERVRAAAEAPASGRALHAGMTEPVI